ncbi:MAG: cupin domain-containing protein [Anaerolineae bacterium]|nr:cupin domain-containing protein [Anaerolineae bacterium]
MNNVKRVTPIESDHGETVYELLGAASGGSQAHSLAQVVLAPGKACLKHYHPTAEESYIILSGTGRMIIDDVSKSLGPGDAVAILPGQVHQVFNDTGTDLVFLAVCVPAWTPDNSVFLD